MLEKLLPELQPDDVKVLESACVMRSAPIGTVLIEQGSTNRDLFFLVSGGYEVYQKVSMAHRYFAIKIASLSGPLVFGEVNFLTATERSATVLISREAKYLRLPYEAAEKVCDEHPRIAINLYRATSRTVAERLIAHQQKIMERMIANASQPTQALLLMQQYIGEAKVCPPELAAKLFNIHDNTL